MGVLSVWVFATALAPAHPSELSDRYLDELELRQAGDTDLRRLNATRTSRTAFRPYDRHEPRADSAQP